jgi:hypothetical protein
MRPEHGEAVQSILLTGRTREIRADPEPAFPTLVLIP